MKKQEHSPASRVLFNVAVVVLVMTLPLIAVTTRASITNTPVDHSQQQEKSTEELKLEYAKLNLQLAQTELKLAEQFNLELDTNIPATVAGEQRRHMLSRKQISKAVMERLKSNVAIGREQLAQATTPSTGSSEKIRMHYAEEKIRLAKIKLDAIKADKLAGKPVRELEVTQLELKYKLAQLKSQLLGSPEYLFEVVDSLQRQIDQLNEELIAQDQRITATEDRLSENTRD